MKVSTEIDNNFGYEKITQLVDNIPLTLMMILVLHIKRQSYKVSIFYNKRLSSIMPEENKDCIKYVQVGNGNKFVSGDDRNNVENYPSKNQVFDEKS